MRDLSHAVGGLERGDDIIIFKDENLIHVRYTVCERRHRSQMRLARPDQLSSSLDSESVYRIHELGHWSKHRDTDDSVKTLYKPKHIKYFGFIRHMNVLA